MIIESGNQLEYLQYKSLIEEYRALYSDRQLVIWGRGICGLHLGWVCEQENVDFVYTDRNEEYWDTYIKLDEDSQTEKTHKTLCPAEVLSHRESYFVIVAMERGQEVVRQLEMTGGVYSRDFFVIISATENEVIQCYKQDKVHKREMALGDCALISISSQESNQQSLKEMLEETYEQMRVVAMANVYMRAYYNLYRLMQARQDLSRLVLFLDISVLAPKYNELAKTQHFELWENITVNACKDEELTDFLRTIQERSGNSLADFSIPDRRKNESREKVIISKRNHMRLNYLFDLREDENTIYLRKLICDCIRNKTELLLVLLPVNYEEGIELAGNLFSERYERIRARLADEINKYEDDDCSVCDLSYLLPKEDFISVRSINEGYRYSGRLKIMQKIDEELYNGKDE